LTVLDVAEVLGQRFARQSFGFPLASFVPSDPPSFGVLSFVHPWLSHSLNCIGGLDHPSEKQALALGVVVTKWRQGQGPWNNSHCKSLL
jgi:hypothetical protein